jgi:hypothetical protein
MYLDDAPRLFIFLVLLTSKIDGLAPTPRKAIKMAFD